MVVLATSNGALDAVVHYYSHTHSMWNLLLYNCAVAAFIFLYWFHKPKTEDSSKETTSKKEAGNANSKFLMAALFLESECMLPLLSVVTVGKTKVTHSV